MSADSNGVQGFAFGLYGLPCVGFEVPWWPDIRFNNLQHLSISLDVGKRHIEVRIAFDRTRLSRTVFVGAEFDAILFSRGFQHQQHAR